MSTACNSSELHYLVNHQVGGVSGEGEMSSGPEVIVPIGTQKHDPAWKHCLMVRANDRTKLKCLYCTKLFLGGGIHRIKEHLAKQKGNASRCPRVPPEVQDEMQLSLEGGSIRKKRKSILAEEAGLVNPLALEASGFESPMLSPLNIMDPNAMNIVVKEDTTSKGTERGRRRKPRCSTSLISISNVSPPVASDGSLPKLIMAPTIDKDQVHMAIGRFLFEAGVPMEAVNSVYFQPMIDAIQAARPALEPPSCNELSGWILKQTTDDINSITQHYKLTWIRTGCSLLADEWTTEMGKTLINFLACCPEGTMFLKSVDASEAVTSADALFELLKDVVVEVGINNVVQVITNNTNTHIEAGRRLMEAFPTLFWMPCASRCVDAMLEDISKLHAIDEILDSAKSITTFIYNRASVLNLMRRHTNGKDLLVIGETMSVTNFATLKRMVDLKEELKAMVRSDEWLGCSYSNEPPGIAVTKTIISPEFWSSSVVAVHLTEYLVQLLKWLDSNKWPMMGYIHACMCIAKEKIKKELMKKSCYMPYCNIIYWQWYSQIPRPLCAAGFFLNPHLFYCNPALLPNATPSELLDCIERLVPEGSSQDQTMKELNMYKSATGDFGRKMAARARSTLFPAEWWSTYGGGCPNLTHLAIRILSQTCSSKGCQKNHIPFEKIHDRMSVVELQRLRDLVSVQYNLRLQQRQHTRNKPLDSLSAQRSDMLSGWVTHKKAYYADTKDDINWTLLISALDNQTVAESDEGDFESFIAELDPGTILAAAQGVEDAETFKEESDNVAGFTCDLGSQL